jgi:hypothetical protein
VTRLGARAIHSDPRIRRISPGLRYEGPGGAPRGYCGRQVASRTIVISLKRRGFARPPVHSASLSAGFDFVARFPRGYRVWQLAH